MRIPNLSRAASALQRQARFEDEQWEDLGRFDGSGDCGSLVARSIARQRRQTRRLIHGLTGYRAAIVAREIERRTSPRWTYFSGILQSLGLGGIE